MPEVRLSNHQLSTAIAGMLRRLTVNGLNRDRETAEELIWDLHARLCPQPRAKDAVLAAPLPASHPDLYPRHGAGKRDRSPYADGPRPALPAHPEYRGRR